MVKLNKRNKLLLHLYKNPGMKKVIYFILTIMLSAEGYSQPKSMNVVNNTIYSFKTKTLDGKNFDLASLKGKKILIVNTASKCGYTPQYKELEELYKKYGGDKFTIIGFPANNFGNQEPGTDTEIQTFCERNYGVTFPMMSKISVKGSDIDPIYQWLTKKELNGQLDSEVKWNFQKYLIDENGKLVDVEDSKITPLSDVIVNWINK